MFFAQEGEKKEKRVREKDEYVLVFGFSTPSPLLKLFCRHYSLLFSFFDSGRDGIESANARRMKRFFFMLVFAPPFFLSRQCRRRRLGATAERAKQRKERKAAKSFEIDQRQRALHVCI